jgi:LacI family repressor for deo operon, udp, cdd, tsx, nupC, and nupG
VQKAAQTLGYQLNQQAIDFRRGRSNALLVLVSDVGNPFYSEFFKGIEEHARSSGYTVLIGDTASSPTSEQSYIAMFHAGKADGLITSIGRLPHGIPRPPPGSLPYAGPPIVSCNLDAGVEIPSIRIDNDRAGRDAARHLLDLGHQRFAQIHGSLEYDDFNARLRGFGDAVAEAGHPIDRAMLIEGNRSIEDGRKAAETLFSGGRPPTAIFAHNDEMALGAMHQLSTMGLRVPEDVSVVGFDDLNYAGFISPTLTTMHLPRRSWGAAACKKLIELINRNEIEHDTIIHAELIARGSSGPVKS